MKKLLTLCLCALLLTVAALPFVKTGGGGAKAANGLPDGYAYSGTNWTDPAIMRLYDAELADTLIDPRADGATKIDNATQKRETYKPADRQWQGLPTVARTGGRLWAVWYTGGGKEPHQFNYLAVAYSGDEGKTWVDPWAVIDHPDLNRAGVSLVLPNFFLTPSGDLWLYFLQSQTWGIKITNPDAANIADVQFAQAKAIGNFKEHKPPTAIVNENGAEEWLMPAEAMVGSDEPSVTSVWSSVNQGATWSVKSRVTSSAASVRKWGESQIAQTADGRLILVSRIEKGTAGGLERAISSDFGKTWQPFENNLPQPFIGPGSKVHFMKLSTGSLLMVNHATTSSRSLMTAYLSTDDGETWPYRLTLDGRDDVSYPYAYEYGGKIYAAWDKGRYKEKEIRFACITEGDIKAGAFRSAGAVDKGVISKTGPYRDVAEITTEMELKITRPVGTESDTLKAALPTALAVKDTDGKEYALTGAWSSKGYKKDAAGVYKLIFEPDALPTYLQDTYGILSVEVTLEEEKQPDQRMGCGCGAAAAYVPLLVAGLLLFKRKRA
ncbi:MAG: glycoside hydrolase [Clostridiales bacterium]|nr:glycoside hydrolase [Clostridiales bacterium]